MKYFAIKLIFRLNLFVLKPSPTFAFSTIFTIVINISYKCLRWPLNFNKKNVLMSALFPKKDPDFEYFIKYARQNMAPFMCFRRWTIVLSINGNRAFIFRGLLSLFWSHGQSFMWGSLFTITQISSWGTPVSNLAPMKCKNQQPWLASEVFCKYNGFCPGFFPSISSKVFCLKTITHVCFDNYFTIVIKISYELPDKPFLFDGFVTIFSHVHAHPR